MLPRMTKSWEKSRDELHSTPGVEDLKKVMKEGLQRKYYGIAETMFRYDGLDDEKFRDMNEMSRDTMPERLLMDQGQLVTFAIGDQLHMLPMSMEGGLNIYGHPQRWRAIPIGWSAGLGDVTFDKIYSRVMSYDDSVIIRNDRWSGSDKRYIDKCIDLLVDNLLTVNQLQLLARNPFWFDVSEDNLLTAKNAFLAISEARPVIFTNINGESTKPSVVDFGVTIDPAIHEIFDRIECQILEYLGFPCVPITKRAQQTVSEVNSNIDKIYMRRMEKLEQRQKACDRINELFGTNLTCVSVIDETQEIADTEAENDITEEEEDPENEL